jgi:hypothetical protein
MRTRRAVPAVVAALLAASAAFAQAGKVEKGSRDDLKGATTVFVDAAASPEMRDVIVADLETRLPGIHFARRLEDADLVLRFETTLGRPSRPEPVAMKGGMTHQSNPEFSPGWASGGAVANGEPVVRAGQGMPRGTVPDFDFGPVTSRYGFGSVLRVRDDGRVVEALKFRQAVFNRPETVARDFARKFVKEFRKANGLEDK